MGNGLTGQGPMVGGEAAAREANLNAVREDLFMTLELLDTLDQRVRNLQEHLMGAAPMPLEKGQLTTEKAQPPSGIIPQLCTAGSTNIQKLRRILERVSQVCHELNMEEER